uniref:Uncharacterized protein n=1 Tax=Fagus sylvatica TaxID=28930 RepID=A0A2N9GJF2_FAGSY
MWRFSDFDIVSDEKPDGNEYGSCVWGYFSVRQSFFDTVKSDARRVLEILEQDGLGFDMKLALDKLCVRISGLLVREVLLGILRNVNYAISLILSSLPPLGDVGGCEISDVPTIKQLGNRMGEGYGACLHSTVENICEDRAVNSHKDVFIECRDDGNGQKTSASLKGYSDESKCKEDLNPQKEKVGLKATFHEDDETSVPYEQQQKIKKMDGSLSYSVLQTVRIHMEVVEPQPNRPKLQLTLT